MIVFALLCKAQANVAEFRTANCSSVCALTYTTFTLSHTSCLSFFGLILQILLITSGMNTDHLLFPIVSSDLHDKPYFVSWCDYFYF